MSAVFLEYAWDMGWCDPCAAEPLSREELRRLGVFWLDDSNGPAGGGQEVFLSRLHLRYDGRHFPEDLVLQETPDRTNFQGRYILRHAYAGKLMWEANEYREELGRRSDRDAKTLVSLTGWRIGDVRQRMGLAVEPAANRKWYEKLWDR